ncbi:hypothetical protein DH2020_033837 [Rehmannia glutinosa]|uniref:NAC domain-containing protein n=1 Tax=Rehmannia glutinosa TaxID=99300 RepID=A0ABR0VB24_REHGL
MMMSSDMMIPPGYRFRPTDQQLINHYLLRKAIGLPIPWSILEKDLYGENANPWDVFSDVSDSAWDIVKDVNRVIYVFTKLSKVNAEKTRIARRAGCGTWEGQTTRKIFNASKKLIGFMKMFSFKVTKEGGSEDRDDHWIMHEYSLAGVSLQYELKYKDYYKLDVYTFVLYILGFILRSSD